MLKGSTSTRTVLVCGTHTIRAEGWVCGNRRFTCCCTTAPVNVHESRLLIVLWAWITETDSRGNSCTLPGDRGWSTVGRRCWCGEIWHTLAGHCQGLPLLVVAMHGCRRLQCFARCDNTLNTGSTSYCADSNAMQQFSLPCVAQLCCATDGKLSCCGQQLPCCYCCIIGCPK